MKKLSLIAAAMILFAGVSFAQTAPAKKDTKAKTEKKTTKTDKKSDKTTKKSDKKATK